MDKLKNPKYREHIDRISFVENKDFCDVVKQYDSPTTYFYMDPPYWKTENYYSNHDFDVNDHIRLAECMKGIEGKFSLSYYDFPQLVEWFPIDQFEWRRENFKKAAAAKKDGTQNEGTELLIMNYKAPQVEGKVAKIKRLAEEKIEREEKQKLKKLETELKNKLKDIK
jgi:site-specific DNA-adenine methylase